MEKKHRASVRKIRITFNADASRNKQIIKMNFIFIILLFVIGYCKSKYHTYYMRLQENQTPPNNFLFDDYKLKTSADRLNSAPFIIILKQKITPEYDKYRRTGNIFSFFFYLVLFYFIIYEVYIYPLNIKI